MKYLFYNSCSFAHPHFGTLLDEAERLNNEGHEVIFTYCSGILDTCFLNTKANYAKCILCKLCYHESLSKLNKGIKIIPLVKSVKKEESNFVYGSVDDIKKIIFKNVYVGYAVLSLYISITRNPSPEITKSSKQYFDHLIDQTCNLTSLIYDLLDEYKPDAISIYNGRFFENRPFFDIALSQNLQFISNEIVGGSRSDELFNKVFFKNCLPHDITTTCNRIKYAWEIGNEKYEEKKKIGESFFLKRRAGIPAADRVYIKDQIKGKLPISWDKEKTNIVIFNSSEDEFAAVGSDFEKYSLFKTQIEGVKFLLSTNTNIKNHFYLRIHPNLKSIKYAYHTDLYLLNKLFNNITIIGPSEPISTYDVMDAADKVIVFGSTMGIEAAYWNKPVILLSGSMYYYLDICYIPKTNAELIFLLGKDLVPKDNFPAIQYGYYMMNRALLSTKSIYFDINNKAFSFLGFKITAPKYLTLWGSNWLIKIATVIWLRTITHLFRNKIRLPDPTFVE